MSRLFDREQQFERARCLGAHIHVTLVNKQSLHGGGGGEVAVVVLPTQRSAPIRKYFFPPFDQGQCTNQ